MQSRFKDKYFSILGDSISTFEGKLPEGYPSFYSYRGALVTGLMSPRDSWWGQVIDHFGGRLLVNNSWSGSYVCCPKGCEIESYGCSDARTSGLSEEGTAPDHIFVFIGTNDRGAGFPLESEDKSDLSVIANAYDAMLKKLRSNYPRAEIRCITFPITTCTRDVYFEFPRTGMERYGELIKSVAEKNSCFVVDLWDENDLCDTIDHLHPNFAGMTMIANKVIAAMESEGGDTK